MYSAKSTKFAVDRRLQSYGYPVDPKRPESRQAYKIYGSGIAFKTYLSLIGNDKSPGYGSHYSFHLKNGKDKNFVCEHLLNEYYPDWANKSYADIHDDYTFYSTCPGTVGPAIICFLDSKDYVDCIKLAISLGGDADTLAAIAGPMAYAYYKHMPDALVYQALKKLPDWMVDVSERFDSLVNGVK